ncbi:DNA repair protein rad16 [Nannizzia gypsea CBS 118893]|uniref:DNA repair protein rad16 n=1 Tax=Arthroderma gypseum (strain ATCC MYA-4604 / CBS 118893) TaxID=535722 RepID=E5R0C2_ARTGP|nr:DNA repair protein rad16 [Nannizzia gypsea CBS 118893]EFQ98318.1 DNA repair protein rad16 [Nannizzia gypsea CBS 118893]
MSSGPPSSLVKLSLPLQYQQDLLNELRSEDELVVLAQGLGLLRIITNLLHTYDAAGNNLIVLVGATDRENEWIGEALAEHYAVSKSPLARGLKVINTDRATVSTRHKMYSEGGIISVTSRILVVDLLSRLLDSKLITGMIILHAEKQYNKDGMLKAFSDSPEPFTTGFAPLSNMLRNLFLQKTSLWPRFQVTVAESLEGHRKAEVIELEVPMTDKMKEIQNAVLECVEVNIRELKRANTGLDIGDDWTVDSALHKNFDVAIRRQLDPVWHRVSFRTRQIASDLTVLRSILHSLLTFDAVSLNKYLDTVISAHSAPAGSTKQNYSPWLFLEAAHVLFDTAKSRVYKKKASDKTNISSSDIFNGLEPILEEQPKWAVLAEVLEEIEQDTYLNSAGPGSSNNAILIMCSDQQTCRQVREYLSTMHKKEKSFGMDEGNEREATPDEDDHKPSAGVMMRRKLREYLVWKRNLSNVNNHLYDVKPKAKGIVEVPGFTSISSAAPQGHSGRGPPNKRRRVRGGSSAASTSTSGRPAHGSVQIDTEDFTEAPNLSEEAIQQAILEEVQHITLEDDLEDMDKYYELYDVNDLLVVHHYDGDMDEHVLEELRPRYIIMYEPDAAFIRRVEVYRSSHQERNVRVYFMYYGESVEEQRYLSAVRREKDAFTKLIHERGTMAMKLVHDKGLEDPQEQFLRTVNTRIAGGGRLAATAAPPTVVVDVREFRSALPSLLHGRSMVVVPCQLTVGDYIITPDICVERKSVRDLISSLKNGRLYTQAETMLQHYSQPMLLIEFDQNKAFTFDAFTSSATPTSFVADNATSFGSGNMINPTNPRSAQHLLVLLTLAFPRLKIIWSSSPYQTAEIFAELKKNNSEPDPIRAVQVGLDFNISGLDTSDGQPADMIPAAGIEHRVFSLLPQDMIRAVPGVEPKTLERLILETKNIHEVANMSVEQLEPLVGKEAARKIFKFFTRSVFDAETVYES